ncbi:hypothetical protein TanjilG_06732 [Lupinus angustifolius]|uniref:RING-type E3 ubiquitin transferase n=2 Tax=Lupinus angustifolius TaxID=3871 RepID=A0A1J7HID8_LUPAN|nr:hypothetical protein TanjilG_06732 [Lupinus angustifolius]
MSLFLPFIFGSPESSPPSGNNEDPYQENDDNEDSHRQRIILVNPFTQGMVVVDGASSLENLFRELGSSKSGHPPASKESIEAIPSVEIVGSDDLDECVVCLEEFEVGGVAKVMPCKHKFHPNCIEKWLGIHGNCPVCRYQMPVEEKDGGMKRDEEEGRGERRRVGGGEVWVSFSINRGRRRSHDSNQAPSGDSSDNSYSPSDAAEVEN